MRPKFYDVSCATFEKTKSKNFVVKTFPVITIFDFDLLASIPSLKKNETH